VMVGGGSRWSSFAGVLGFGACLDRADSRNGRLLSGKGSGWIFCVVLYILVSLQGFFVMG